MAERVQGVSFSETQLDRLRELLALRDRDEAFYVSAMIEGRMDWCRREAAARERTPHIEDAKRRLDHLANCAARLVRLLEEEPEADRLVHIPGSMLDADALRAEDGAIDVPGILEARAARLASFIETARIIRNVAEGEIKDDRNHRSGLGLSPKRYAGKAPHAWFLWPELFAIWQAAGFRVAKTAHGPLHRFVLFVHEVYGLSPVPATTVRDAVAAWLQDGSRTYYADGPPWRADPEVS